MLCSSREAQGIGYRSRVIVSESVEKCLTNQMINTCYQINQWGQRIRKRRGRNNSQKYSEGVQQSSYSVLLRCKLWNIDESFRHKNKTGKYCVFPNYKSWDFLHQTTPFNTCRKHRWKLWTWTRDRLPNLEAERPKAFLVAPATTSHDSAFCSDQDVILWGCFFSPGLYISEELYEQSQ